MYGLNPERMNYFLSRKQFVMKVEGNGNITQRHRLDWTAPSRITLIWCHVVYPLLVSQCSSLIHLPLLGPRAETKKKG